MLLKLLLPMLVTLTAQPMRRPVAAIPIDSPMHEMIVTDSMREIVRFHPRSLAIWTEALSQPDLQTRQLAMFEIGLAHRQGMKDLDKRVGAKLAELLESGSLTSTVRLTAAQTLAEIGAKESASTLLTQNARHGGELALVTDSALAEWGYAPAIELWLLRIDDPKIGRTERVSAIRSLATCEASRAIEPLTRLVLDRNHDSAFRLVCARALSRIQKQGLEDLAAAIIEVEDAISTDRILGIELLSRCDSERSRLMLTALVESADNDAAQLALRRLAADDPKLLSPYVDRLMVNADATLRALAVEALAATGDKAATAKLVSMLNDPSAELRGMVRDRVFQVASVDKQGDNVIGNLMALVHRGASREWRDWEFATAEAMLLLGRLKHAPAAPHLVQRLDSPSNVVRVCAVVSMRYLGDRSVLPALEERAWRLAVNVSSRRQDRYIQSAELEQVFQTLGALKYEQAKALLIQYLPKDRAYVPARLRAAAIWALGAIYEDQPDEEIVRLLVDRVQDVGMRFSERQEVRHMAAVAIGMMNARDQIDVLRSAGMANDYDSDIHLACLWAICRMTNQPMPKPPVRYRDYNGAFLEPFDH